MFSNQYSNDKNYPVYTVLHYLLSEFWGYWECFEDYFQPLNSMINGLKTCKLLLKANLGIEEK
jgi:hypothetical protein